MLQKDNCTYKKTGTSGDESRLGRGFETTRSWGYHRFMTPILIQVQHLCFYLFNLALLDEPCKSYTYTECTVNGVLNSTRPGSSGGNSGAVVRTGSVRRHAAMQVETTQFWKFALLKPLWLSTRTINTHYTVIYKNTKALESWCNISNGSDYCLLGSPTGGSN